MWLWLAIFSVVYVLVKIEWNRLRISRRFKHIPGPREYPIIGNIMSAQLNDPRDFVRMLDSVCVAPTCKITFGGKLILIVMEPVQLQQILSKKEFLEKPMHFEFLQLKYGLFSAKYSLWKPIRKATSPTLSQASVIGMVPIFNKHLDNLLITMGNYLNKGTFNVEECLVKFGIEQVFETMVGHHFTCSDEIKNAFQDTGVAVYERAVNVLYHPDFIYKYTSLRKKHDGAFNILKEMFNPIVLQRKKILEFGLEKGNFIDELIKMDKDGKTWTDDLIEDNFLSIILAGYETTSLTMAFAILMLAMHPEFDEKLYNEISEYYKHGDDLTYDTVKQMPYLDMVCKEVLRLFPAVPGTLKEALVDTFIENIGLIPKGTIVACPTFKMHRNREVWGEDAESFNPDHFLPEKSTGRHLYSYLPFSAGPRNCIGMHYANINVRMGLVKILARYRFTTKMKMEDLRLKMAVTLRLTTGHDVEVHLR